MGDFEFLGRIREQADKYAFSSDVDAGSEAFPGPSLIISGRQDAIVGYQDAWNILEKYPRATYAVLDRAGHLMEDQQAVVRVLMRDWLSRVEEAIKYNQG
jgi:pimeloyl-ACP methyl ester carboxylesterase